MTKLINRMRPSYLAELKDIEKLYPKSLTSCFKELNEKYFWTDLSYASVGVLVNHLGINDYNPSAVAQIFENE